MFIGDNLTNLRIMHGYSRKQLSDLIGVTEQAVWQYENNYTSPKLEIINQLKEIFNVKSKYFYTKDIISRYSKPDNIKVMNIAYRSKIINVVSKTQAEAKHVEYLDAFVDCITDKIKHPTMKIISLRDEAIKYLNNSNEDRITQINHIAELARKRLDFKNYTNDDLMFLIEKSGVFIFEKAIGEEIDAYSLWTQTDRPYIILGNIKRSAVRRNFDIAHELGHLLLHYRTEFNTLDRKEHKSIENEANTFAGAFLLPKEEFQNDMKSINYTTDPDAYTDLKKKWGTSLQVLAYRAANLNIIDSRKHRNFYAALHRKGYLKSEPLDEVIPLQKPLKIKSIINLVATKELIDIRQMVEIDWNVEISFFHQMTGIDLSFFKKYLVNLNDFGLNNTIELPVRTSNN